MHRSGVGGLRVRIQLVRSRGAIYAEKISGPGDVSRLLSHLRREDREQLVCIYLNATNVVLGVEMVSMGTVTASLVHPRECMKSAILLNATGIIIVHNHPSGDATPSDEDIATTRRMAEVCKLMGIPLLDHIIIGKDGFASLKEKGVLTQSQTA